MTKIIKSLNKNNPFYFCIDDFQKRKTAKNYYLKLKKYYRHKIRIIWGIEFKTLW